MSQTIELLRKYEDKHKVSYKETAKDDVIPVVKAIQQGIGSKESRFSVNAIDCTGSIYQKVKIDKPDEFDFDFPLSALEINDIDEAVTSSSTGKHCFMIRFCLFKESLSPSTEAFLGSS